ncbi:type I-F CRISPR-associated endoribonuclease Cas6/Csy4 [Pseudomonas aeruginosa]|nr:type I-F CRISPR-associated endoribonuclease Cas6/Csy4 [Pseudomonas aeruginosa]
MRDHLQFGEPAVVPHPTPYRQVSRVQAKSNPERLRRRLMRRHDLSEEEARKRIPDTVARALDLPFVTLRSQSTGQHFRLFIRHGPLQVTAEEGGFTCYGLSKEVSFPGSEEPRQRLIGMYRNEVPWKGTSFRLVTRPTANRINRYFRAAGRFLTTYVAVKSPEARL